MILAFINKKKQKGRNSQYKAVLLNELHRNLNVIDNIISRGARLQGLENYLYRKLLVTSKIYHQQGNLSKSHVPLIIRGKAEKKTEFGAKISILDGNSFADLDRIS